MPLAYVDTSCLLALAFDEPGAGPLGEQLGRCEVLVSSTFLEAEILSALHREGVDGVGELLDRLTWLEPRGRLTVHLQAVLSQGYVRGADLWHLASALYLREDAALLDEPETLVFATLDHRQQKVATGLGFVALDQL